jgi:hypothetical protein
VHKQEKQDEHEAYLKSDRFIQGFSTPKFTPLEYDLKGYDKNYWVVEYFSIGKRKRKLYSTNRVTFDEWFFKSTQSADFNDFYYSIGQIIPKAEHKCLYVLKLYSSDATWEIDILDFQQFCHETPLFFLLYFNFTHFIDTNGFLDYHLIDTFKSDKHKFKTYLKDALLAWQEEMTFEEKHLAKLQDYMNDNLSTDFNTLPVVVNIPLSIENEMITTKWEKIKKILFEDIEEGMGQLNDEQISNLINLFYKLKNKKKQLFLSSNDTIILQKIGLKLPVNEGDFLEHRFTLNIDETEKNFFYQLLYAFWLKNRESDRSGSKVRYARYLRTYFTNFPDSDKPIFESMRVGRRWSTIEQLVENCLKT